MARMADRFPSFESAFACVGVDGFSGTCRGDGDENTTDGRKLA
jgi:hypothetical protein